MNSNPDEPPNQQELPDEELVRLATEGNTRALEQLLVRHEIWIFNLLFYVLQSRQDAEDATQEVLVKVTTGLASFKQESSFRTWVRRIAVNHALDFKRSRPEQTVAGFGCYAAYLKQAADADLAADNRPSPETALLIEEARISCVMGMLLCLDREQRVVFLLGEILDTGDVLGAEVLGLSRENFRQRLCRAREQLTTFLHDQCGLVNPANSCRCARKTSAFIRDGIVDPERLEFAQHHLARVTLDANRRDQQFESLLARTQAELRELYPLFAAPHVTARLLGLLQGSELKTLLHLN